MGGVWSRVALTWAAPVLAKGHARYVAGSVVSEEDLLGLGPGDRASALLAAFRASAARLAAARARVSVSRVLWDVLRGDFWGSLALYVVYAAVQFLSPFLVGRLVDAVAARPVVQPIAPVLDAALLFLVQVVALVTSTHSDLILTEAALKAKTALHAAVFLKALHTSAPGGGGGAHEAQAQTAAAAAAPAGAGAGAGAGRAQGEGGVVNLVSTDAVKALDGAAILHRALTAPAVIVAGVAYIYAVVGTAVFAGVVLMGLMGPLTQVLLRRTLASQAEAMAWTDVRVRRIREMVAGIKVVKLMGFEAGLLRDVVDARRAELGRLRATQLTWASFGTPLTIALPPLASVATFLVFTAQGHTLAPSDAFVVVTLWTLLRMPFTFLPQGLQQWVQVSVSLQRFDAYLDLAADSPHAEGAPWEASLAFDALESPPEERTGSGAATAHGACIGWPGGPEDVLRDVTLDLGGDRCVAVVGKVGSGKSTLLGGLLGEARVTPGAGAEEARSPVGLSGRVAYVPQTPFLCNATVRDNILFGSPWNAERYGRVVAACCLEHDLEGMPDGDATEIGERGINVSGGQAQRVALARAAYSDADVVVLDDPLSALDAEVQESVFADVILGLMAGRLRILATHAVHLVGRADTVLLVADGRVTEAAGGAEAVEVRRLSADLLDASAGEEARPGHVRVGVEEPAPLPPSPAAPVLLQEEGQAGARLVVQERHDRGGVPWGVYAAWLLAGCYGSPVLAACLLSLFVLAEASFVSIDTWLATWSGDGLNQPTSFYVGVYGLLSVLYLAFTLARSVAMCLAGVRAAEDLHAGMLSGVFRAPMRFFDTVPSGRILSRFAKDVGEIDTQLEQRISWFLATTFRVASICGLVVGASPLFLLALAPLSYAYHRLSVYYRHTFRELQRLDSIANSPVVSALTEAIGGLDSVRAYRAQRRLCLGYFDRVEASTRASSNLRVVSLWLTQRLSMLGALAVFAIALLVALSATSWADAWPIPATTGGTGYAALALAYSLNLIVNLQVRVKLATEAEAKMTSVQRVLEYSEELDAEDVALDLPPRGPNQGQSGAKAEAEAKAEAATVVADDPGWPHDGAVAFEGVDFRYRDDTPLVLQGCTFRAEGGSTTGVVGRTGAGKSSLAAAMFRVAELSGGCVRVGGRDVRDVPLPVLRRTLGILPQQPVVFGGTLRRNVDMLSEHTDADVLGAMDIAGLTPTLPGRGSGAPDGVLDFQVDEGGSNLSVGQRQLLCLARVCLRRPRVLLLDEATASVDKDTDAQIMATIARVFRGATVIVVAHRLRTVVSCDTVVGVRDGRVVEHGPPAQLLQPGAGAGLFLALVEDTGADEASALKALARDLAPPPRARHAHG